MNIIEKKSCKWCIQVFINSLYAFSNADLIEQTKKAPAMVISFGLQLAMHLVSCELFFICISRLWEIFVKLGSCLLGILTNIFCEF